MHGSFVVDGDKDIFEKVRALRGFRRFIHSEFALIPGQFCTRKNVGSHFLKCYVPLLQVQAKFHVKVGELPEEIDLTAYMPKPGVKERFDD